MCVHSHITSDRFTSEFTQTQLQATVCGCRARWLTAELTGVFTSDVLLEVAVAAFRYGAVEFLENATDRLTDG